ARGDDSLTRVQPARPVAPVSPRRSGVGHDFGRVAIHDAAAAGTRGPGGPLPFLDRIQQSFGAHDVTGARAHVDAGAAQASRALGANAFTFGGDVAFAARPTLRSAAHEAAHVVQQRGGMAPEGGVGKAGDRYERQANEAAERVADGRSSEDLFDRDNVRLFNPRRAVQRDEPPKAPATQPTSGPTPGPTPAAATQPLRYTRITLTLGSPAAAWTEAALESRLKSTLKSIAVTGVTASMPADTKLFLLYTLLRLSGKDYWGHELDVVAPITRAPKKGDPDPLGRLTVRIDDQGNGSIELVAAGPVPQSPQVTLADATTKLKADFGFAAVRDDGTATWSDPEISDVAAALAMLPGPDKGVLKGVELIRVSTIEGGFAGEFSPGGGVAAGATAVMALPYLKLADGAFDKTGLSVVGGAKLMVPSSYNVIVHEVGHAVEKENLRTATDARAKAHIDLNKKAKPVNDSAAKHKKLSEQYTKLYGEWKAETDPTKKAALAAKLGEINTALAAELAKNKAAKVKSDAAQTVYDAKVAAVKKTEVAAAIVTPLTADAATAKTAAAGALATAKTAVAALKPDEITSSKAYADAIDATAAAIDAFAKSAKGGDIAEPEKIVLAQVEKRNQERDTLAKAAPTHPALQPLSLAVTAQDDWLSAERTAAGAVHRTLRLQKFVELVTLKKIAPFTDYAKKNWPFKPEEFYAEAYTLWLTDPEFLSHNYKDVYDFFEGGEYRK
ncbi:MAG: Peptidoglycan-binding domain 1 protein, partial [Acidobacteria bacterium]|nr:Peptidoglycan-binding domain 1 protein [Acidobacteriota bacterium]